MHTRTSLANDLRTLGVAAGDALAVHSSLRSLGKVDGGADGVIDALMDVLTPDGTLLMPTMNGPADLWIQSETPSRVGILTEVFRKRPGVSRSIHPTHSVAVWGRHAEHVLAGHPGASALGVGSPFHRLSRLGGKVLMIGVTYTTCSLVHVAEAIAQVPYMDVFYPGYERDLRARLESGVELTFHPFENPGDSGCFEAVERRLLGEGKLARGKVGVADSSLAPGCDVLRASLECLAEDPASLVREKGRPLSAVCEACVEKIRASGWRLGKIPGDF